MRSYSLTEGLLTWAFPLPASWCPFLVISETGLPSVCLVLVLSQVRDGPQGACRVMVGMAVLSDSSPLRNSWYSPEIAPVLSDTSVLGCFSSAPSFLNLNLLI